MDLRDTPATGTAAAAALAGPERHASPTTDRVVAELDGARGTLHRRASIMHGGAIMAFADTVGALGTIANLRDGQGTTTIESKTNFFAGSPVGTRLIAEATPLHRGRRTQVWETRITNDRRAAGGEGDADADGAVMRDPVSPDFMAPPERPLQAAA